MRSSGVGSVALARPGGVSRGVRTRRIPPSWASNPNRPTLVGSRKLFGGNMAQPQSQTSRTPADILPRHATWSVCRYSILHSLTPIDRAPRQQCSAKQRPETHFTSPAPPAPWPKHSQARDCNARHEHLSNSVAPDQATEQAPRRGYVLSRRAVHREAAVMMVIDISYRFTALSVLRIVPQTSKADRKSGPEPSSSRMCRPWRRWSAYPPAGQARLRLRRHRRHATPGAGVTGRRCRGLFIAY